jgi:cytoskeletal protein RodZ
MLKEFGWLEWSISLFALLYLGMAGWGVYVFWLAYQSPLVAP